MNREKILKKIRSKFIATLIFGIFIAVMGSLGIVVAAVDAAVPLMIAAVIMAACGFWASWYGGKNIAHPEKSELMRANPNLLKMVDELCAGIKHEDDLIVFSERLVASKQDLTQIAYFDDILLIYEYKHTVNFITTEHVIKLATADYTAAINVYSYKKEVINALIGMLYRMCPNAVPAQSQQDLNLRISQINKEQRERKKQRKSVN